jgi:hypothetical protein
MALGNHPESEQIRPMGHSTIEEIANGHPQTIADLKDLDPIETAAMFGSLLAMPELQANCIRIEALVHLAVAYCEGNIPPTTYSVVQQFARLEEGYCGRMEDPAEDVFVTLVNTPRGNFRIFEGVLEGAGFHLQRILNIVEGMPNRPPFNQIRSAVAGILHLSDAVAARAGLQENSLGHETPHATLPPEVNERLTAACRLVRFDERELAELQIPKESLTEFVFNLDRRLQLRGQTMGHTDLERRPIAVHDGSFYLLLPTAVATAVIRLVIESVISISHAKAFEHALCQEYSQLFNKLPILGKRLPGSIKFERIHGGFVAAAMTQVDPGRFLHLVFFVDAVDGFVENGLNGLNAQPDVLSKVLGLHIKRASSEAKKNTGFRDGISLVISCGFGRAFVLELMDEIPEGWRMEGIGAHDLVTLNWVDGFDALSLWRLLDAQQTVEKLGVTLLNVNGLLNLVAWSKQLGGHLVPHGQLPDGFVNPASEGVVLVPQNAIRDLRHRVMTEWNPRRVLDAEGRWVKVWKLDKGEFDEDNLAPLYGSEDDVREGRLRGVYVAAKRPWWISISAREDSPNKGVYDRWMMLCAWLRRAAPILDEAYAELPSTPIECEMTFAEIIGATSGPVKPKSAEQLRALIQISAKPGSPRIAIHVAQGFDDGLAQPENFAERTLVAALVEAVANAADEHTDSDKQARLVAQICPGSEARSGHRIQARSFRDFVRSEIQTKLVFIDTLDDAASRIGLGWRVRSRDSNPEISGVKECTSYLNDVVRVQLDDLCASLRTLDRRLFVEAVLKNHEATASDRDIWKQTARAILAMHDDKAAAMRTIVQHHARLNASFLATRILLEAAICECPLAGGNIPGRLDLSRAMAQVVFSHHVGGWSDAIHWGAMEPRVKVTPLGDVHVNHAFINAVYEPFGRAAAEADVKHAAESYGNLYAPLKAASSAENMLDSQFLDAWAAEFGMSLDGLRYFVDALEDAGRNPPRAVLDLPRSRLIAVLASAAKVSPDQAAATLKLLTLTPRPGWRVVAGEYTDKDWFPWRFRRRLSIFRRPLLQIDEQDDATVFFAPGLVRDALYVMVGSFHSGEIPSLQARSVEMCKWIGHANNVQRTEFNSTVALRMRELGWQAAPEVKLTKLLGRSLDRNYGDIDVLAWRPELGRVLAMECKDLQYNKTLGQVAEQLADFRGELQSDGKPDHLRRHLDRLDVLNAHRLDVAKALKLTSPIQMEGHLVFRNLVPMQFSWERMASRVKLSLFTELDRL